MIRFVHTADWQLGARFSQFGAKGAALREARLSTLRRALELAREREADAFLVAGDLFEDNQVEDRQVANVVGLFAEFDPIPVFLLPGNHDPDSGLESVWHRKAFAQPPPNVHVLRETAAISLGPDAALLASPLRQKLSATDPSLKIAELADSVPEGTIRIGITHGALAIEGKHQPNDFPIALDAASRAGLDYLALGHWHSWLADTDDGRIVMPGTPEPDGFANERGGRVALVEIDGPGKPPKVEALPVATLQWRSLTFDFLAWEASRAAVESAVKTLSPDADRTVLRVTMTGGASPAATAEARSWLDDLVAPFLVGQIVDRTRVELSEAERNDLRARHPILAQVLADIDGLETLATGVPASSGPSSGIAPLALAEAQEILSSSKIELADLDPAFFAKLRQVLFAKLQEVGE